jgi:uncharacterized membrane protein
MSVITEQSNSEASVDSASSVRHSRPTSGGGNARVIGVDVARGLALLGMFAVHIFNSLHANNTPSKTHQIMSGHALATFVLLAGVSLVFITKRRRTDGRLPDAPTAAGLVTRALIITLIGLTLNSALDPDIQVILPYYGLMFLLVIPLLRLRSSVLVGITIALVVVAPLLVTATFSTNLPVDEPTLAMFADPVALISPLVLTGEYPVVAYMAFICLGMVIARLDLSNLRVAARLAIGGAVLAITSWLVSTLLLFRFGGLQHLRAAAPSDVTPQEAQNIILWEPESVASWWWLMERAPYATTPFRMLHDLGVATAWLGLCLLITRLRFGRWALSSVAAAGAMSLTIYTAHVIVLEMWLLDLDMIPLFVVLVYLALSFAALWRRSGRRGPLEALVASASSATSRLVESRVRAQAAVRERKEQRRARPAESIPLAQPSEAE